jgi:hypothetical protein
MSDTHSPAATASHSVVDPVVASAAADSVVGDSVVEMASCSLSPVEEGPWRVIVVVEGIGDERDGRRSSR